MNDQTDSQLLRAYAEHRSEPAFTELVRRHLDFVHSAALRMVCDSHLAQDVTQGVFVALAKNATQLADRAVLSGWLHRTAQNLAAQTVRIDVRRRAREQEAAAMNELLSAEPDTRWEHIAPHLDAALGELSEPDRDALLLRYFERKSASEMARTLGISDEAAQKRVSRAVERLREFFAKRGITASASGLVVVISANAIQAAPAGLALTISTAAALAGTTLATTTATATKAIAMTTLHKTLIAATLAVVTGAGIYEARKASSLQAQVQTLQQQQALLDGQLQKLRDEHDDSANQSASLADKLGGSGSSSELLKLRAEVNRLRNELNEAAAAGKDALAYQAEVLQVLSNTPPVRTLVAASTASVPWNDTAVLGGWKTPSGKRAIILANIGHGDDATQIMITSKILEYTEAAGEKLGFSKFNTDDSLPTRPNTLTAEQASELLRLAQGSEEVTLVGAPRISTGSGDQAQIQVVGQHSTPSGQKYTTGQVVDVIPTVSPDGQSVQLVMTAQLSYLIPILPH